MATDSSVIKPFRPGPRPHTVSTVTGEILEVPSDWVLLAPGDAACTRRVKAAGEHWPVQVVRRRKVISRGVWAPAATVARISAELEQERSTARYAKRRQADAARRARAQAQYVEDFASAVVRFLDFHPRHAALAERLAAAVAAHATPVGSGTVARTQRIPLDERAEAAVIAWMRHRTTAYDSLKIPRHAGMRHDVRRRLAARSRKVLASYRSGEDVGAACPLEQALARTLLPDDDDR
jgi:hypothetical protein